MLGEYVNHYVTEPFSLRDAEKLNMNELFKLKLVKAVTNVAENNHRRVCRATLKSE